MTFIIINTNDDWFRQNIELSNNEINVTTENLPD